MQPIEILEMRLVRARKDGIDQAEALGSGVSRQHPEVKYNQAYHITGTRKSRVFKVDGVFTKARIWSIANKSRIIPSREIFKRHISLVLLVWPRTDSSVDKC